MSSSNQLRLVVVANPECRRLELLSAALQHLGQEPPVVVFYEDLITGKTKLQTIVRPGDIVRLESPGRNWEVEKLLLGLGASKISGEPEFSRLSPDQIHNMGFDKGRIWPSRQWYLGLREILNEIAAQLEQCAPHFATHCPRDVLTMFDKPACHHLLQSNGVPMPEVLAVSSNFEQFLFHLRAAGWHRAFLKLAHGSSASGVVAFQTNGSQVMATTTTEMVHEKGETRLYNSRRIQTYRTWKEVAILIDALCKERLHIERWFPKASFQRKTCDTRIVVIGGQVWEGIVRLSSGPLTNLHLLNERAPLEALRATMRDTDWNSMVESCERAMSLFPSTLLGGLDVVFSPDFRRHAILELNAWGDLLPGVTRDDLDSYGAQVKALLAS